MSAVGISQILGEHMLQQITHASVASNGANGRLAQFGPLTRDIRVKNIWWSPTGADNATHGTATTSATYKRLELYNGGTAGTATATANRIASLNLTASIASLGASAFTTVLTTNTVVSGSILYFSHSTVGGTDNDGTVLAAGQFSLVYEAI